MKSVVVVPCSMAERGGCWTRTLPVEKAFSAATSAPLRMESLGGVSEAMMSARSAFRKIRAMLCRAARTVHARPRVTGVR